MQDHGSAMDQVLINLLTNYTMELE